MFKKFLSILLVMALIILSGCSILLPGSSPGAPDENTPGDSEIRAYYQTCFDKYVAPWSFYTIFRDEFTEDTFADLPLVLYLLWDTCAYLEGENYTEEYGDRDIPAEVIEGPIMRHFPITSEQLRTIAQ